MGHSTWAWPFLQHSAGPLSSVWGCVWFHRQRRPGESLRGRWQRKCTGTMWTSVLARHACFGRCMSQAQRTCLAVCSQSGAHGGRPHAHPPEKGEWSAFCVACLLMFRALGFSALTNMASPSLRAAIGGRTRPAALDWGRGGGLAAMFRRSLSEQWAQCQVSPGYIPTACGGQGGQKCEGTACPQDTKTRGHVDQNAGWPHPAHHCQLRLSAVGDTGGSEPGAQSRVQGHTGTRRALTGCACPSAPGPGSGPTACRQKAAASEILLSERQCSLLEAFGT